MSPPEYTAEICPTSVALKEAMELADHALALELNEMSPTTRNMTLRMLAHIERQLTGVLMYGYSATEILRSPAV